MDSRFCYVVIFLMLTANGLLAQAQKVLIIGIDGCRPDALEAADVPTIDSLIATGYYSPDALNDGVTFSGPGWSAILTGVGSDKHGVTDNSFSGSNYAEYPSIFSRVENFDGALSTASIVHWNPINDQIVNGAADISINVSTDQAVENEAVQLLSTQNPDLTFLHFDEVDGAGHSGGFDPENPAYIAEIEQVDAHIEQVIAALVARPNYGSENWLILLVPDHGGSGNSHGGNSFNERRVFFIASGPAVDSSVVVRDSVVTPVDDCLNASHELLFDGNNDRVAVAEAAVFNFGDSQDFTVECRVRTTNAADVAIVGDKDWDSGALPGFVLSFRFPSGPEWKVNVGDGSNRSDLNVASIADGAWHSLTVTFDRDGMMTAYQDGVYMGETSMAGIGNITTTGGLFFGADVDNEYDYEGSLAEVRIWNGVLPASSIMDWHCQRLEASHPQYASLLGYWPLNENQGSIANDLASGGNNGTIAGANWQEQAPMVVYDFTHTPRLEDIAVSALQHLCIEIDPVWNLDGVSRVMSCVALPVSWLGISARRLDDGSVDVEWSTVAEQGNAGFVVERKRQGGEEGWVGVSPIIVPSLSQRYRYNDRNAPRVQSLAYRIRQLDFDGSIAHSPIVIATLRTSENTSLSAFPNPVSQRQLTVLLEGKQGVDNSLYLLDMNGREIRQWTGLAIGNHLLKLPKVSPGVYYLLRRDPTGSDSLRLVVE